MDLHHGRHDVEESLRRARLADRIVRRTDGDPFAVVEDRVDRPSLRLRVGETGEHEHDGGIAGRRRFAERSARSGVYRLARQVDRTHDGRVDLARTQRPERDGERRRSRVLLDEDRVARAPEVELRVEPVRGNVGHRPEHARRFEDGDDRVAHRLEPGRIGAERVLPFGESPAHAVACDLGIRLHPDEHARPLARQRREVVDRFACRLQEQDLLAQRLLQIVRREAQALELELHFLGARFAALDEPAATDDGFLERRAIGRRADDAAPADHGDGARRRRGARGSGGARPMLLEDHVRVVPAEAEGAHRGAARALRSPGARFADGLERRAREGGDLVVAMDRRRDRPVLHRLEHLDDARRTGGRDEVAEVRLERADGQRRARAEHVGHAPHLAAVAHDRPGRMALDERDGRRIDSRARVRQAERAGLALLRRCEEPAAAAVVRETDAADDAVDRVAVALGVGESLEREERRALRGHETVGALVERPRNAALATAPRAPRSRRG